MAWIRRPHILPLAADYGYRPAPPDGWPRPTYWTRRWAGDLLRLTTHPVWQVSPLSRQLREHLEGQQGQRLVTREVADERDGTPFAIIVIIPYPLHRPIQADVEGKVMYSGGQPNLVIMQHCVWPCGGSDRDRIAIRSIPLLRVDRDPYGRDHGASPDPGPPPPPEDAEALSGLAL